MLKNPSVKQHARSRSSSVNKKGSRSSSVNKKGSRSASNTETIVEFFNMFTNVYYNKYKKLSRKDSQNVDVLVKHYTKYLNKTNINNVEFDSNELTKFLKSFIKGIGIREDLNKDKQNNKPIKKQKNNTTTGGAIRNFQEAHNATCTHALASQQCLPINMCAWPIIYGCAGEPVIEILQAGSYFDRFGNAYINSGYFVGRVELGVAPPSYSSRSINHFSVRCGPEYNIALNATTLVYKRYQSNIDLQISRCIAAPWFGHDGGATQYIFCGRHHIYAFVCMAMLDPFNVLIWGKFFYNLLEKRERIPAVPSGPGTPGTPAVRGSLRGEQPRRTDIVDFDQEEIFLNLASLIMVNLITERHVLPTELPSFR